MVEQTLFKAGKRLAFIFGGPGTNPSNHF